MVAGGRRGTDPLRLSDGDSPSVALFLDRPDRDLVAAELADAYDVLAPDAGLPDAFDLAVVDERALDARGEALVARAEAAETFLPVLCLLPPDTDPPPSVWERVDDVATRPVSRRELRSRIESLLDTRRLSIRLERRGERLEQVGSVLAHDIRNPLAIATGYVDRAIETGDVDDLGPAPAALDRIDRLIEDVLSLAREGPESLDPVRLDLAATARAAWSSVDTGDATLVPPDEPLRIEADESRLRELLENLFRNSVEHGCTDSRPQADDAVEHATTGDSPRADDAPERDTDALTVTVGALEDGFYVADDGPGIPEADRERIFERGYTTADDGTGFGLAIVATVADLHGWTVAVTESDDGGARFEFTGCAVRDAPVA
jgi:signal transduction histidine kinase